MGVPLLDLKMQYQNLKSELDDVWFDVMGNAGFIGGPRVNKLAEEIASYCETDYCVPCANGTDALFLIMAAMGIGRGDEVITTPWTFFATVECIKHVGATPVFVDIEPGTYNMDVTQIESVITDKTKAIIPVHIFGQCVDMDVVNEIAKKHDLYVIEDACQAIGADYKGKKAGSLADAAAFSFFPSKNLGCAGDGGCITTNNKEIADKANLLAKHGMHVKYHHSTFGTNSRLDALQAAILSVKLPHLDTWNNERREAAHYYNEALAGIGDIELPVERDYGTCVYHLYIIKSQRAEDVLEKFKENGIGTALYYPLSLHKQECFDTIPGWIRPSLPVSESMDSKTFALPCFPGITREQQDEVINVLKSVWS